MPEVNRVPLGLMSLLDTQSMGRAPADLLGSVQAGMDLTALYYNSRGLESATAVSPLQIISAQANVGIIVPEGQLWAVVHVSGRCYNTDVVGTVIGCDVTFFPNANSAGANTISLASAAARNISNGGIVSAQWNWSGGQPLYAKSGSTFGLYMTVFAPLALGSLNEVSILFYRLNI